MIIYNKNKYQETISEKSIQHIERARGIKCLFGGAFATCVYGINNRASDFDFYLIYDKCKNEMATFQQFDTDTLQDLYMLDWDYINTDSQKYLEGIQRYPTILYREHNKQHKFNTHRDDFTSQVLFEILYSDYIWDSGFLMQHIDQILEELSFIGILDYYFSRAYGNLNHNLSKEYVPAVKYLMMFLGYSCMKWLLEYQTIPCMDFECMVQVFAPYRYVSFLREVKKIQKELDTERDYRVHIYDESTVDFFQITPQEADNKKHMKQKKIAMVAKNEDFNNWMRNELAIIAEEMGRLRTSREKVRIKKGSSAFLFQEH